MGLIASGEEGIELGWRPLWAVGGATLMFSISPLLVTRGLALYDDPVVGLTAGIAVTVPSMYLVTRGLTGSWASWARPVWPWVGMGGLAAGFAIAAQWTAFDLIPVGIAIALQQVSTLVVLVAGPPLLRARRERPDARLTAGTGLILAGAVLVAIFGRSLT